MGGGAIRTECNVMAAGITIIANVATMISAQIVGLGSPWERGPGMCGLQFYWSSEPSEANFLNHQGFYG
jgi:hypothetical protein